MTFERRLAIATEGFRGGIGGGGETIVIIGEQTVRDGNEEHEVVLTDDQELHVLDDGDEGVVIDE